MPANNSITAGDDADLENMTSRNDGLESEPADPRIDLRLLTDKVYLLMQQEARLDRSRNGEILWRR